MVVLKQKLIIHIETNESWLLLLYIIVACTVLPEKTNHESGDIDLLVPGRGGGGWGGLPYKSYGAAHRIS